MNIVVALGKQSLPFLIISQIRLMFFFFFSS